MEAIIFCGIQATGKTCFFKEKFFNTHIRISLDLLNTRNKEMIFLETCINIQQRFVVDNTNLTRGDRKKYIDMAKKAKFKVICYYFQSRIADALERNESRTGKERIPEKGLKAAHSRLELPSYNEGFDKIYYVRLNNDYTFEVSEWNDEV